MMTTRQVRSGLLDSGCDFGGRQGAFGVRKLYLGRESKRLKMFRHIETKMVNFDVIRRKRRGTMSSRHKTLVEIGEGHCINSAPKIWALRWGPY